MIEGPFKLSPTEEELDTVISGFSENRAAEISALCREFASRSAAKKQKYLRIIPTIVLRLAPNSASRLRATWNWAARLHLHEKRHVEVERAGQTAAAVVVVKWEFHSIANRFWIRVVTFQKTLFRQRPPNSHQRRLHGQVDPFGVPADLTGIAGHPSGLIPFP